MSGQLLHWDFKAILCIILILVTVLSATFCTNFFYSKAEGTDTVVYTYKQKEPNIFISLLSDGVIFIGELIENVLVEALGSGLRFFGNTFY